MINIVLNGELQSANYLEHIVHFSNLENIFLHGLQSFNTAHSNKWIGKDISLSEVQERRGRTHLFVENVFFSLHDMVPLYFNSKNPMLYLRKEMQSELLIFLFNTDIIQIKNTKSLFSFFSDGNAGSDNTKFYSEEEELNHLDFDLIYSSNWNDPDPEIKREKKRKMCSEVLVYPEIGIDKIVSIICPNSVMLDFVNNLKTKYVQSTSHISTEINHKYFF